MDPHWGYKFNFGEMISSPDIICQTAFIGYQIFNHEVIFCTLVAVLLF